MDNEYLKSLAFPVRELENEAAREAVKEAGMVFVYDLDDDSFSVAYGKEMLEDIAKGRGVEFDNKSISVLAISSDHELNYALAAILTLKGSYCYGKGSDALGDLTEEMTPDEMTPAEFMRKHQAPIRHENLPAELESAMRSTFQSVGRYIEATLEGWELGFMRDTNPGKEVAIWQGIVIAVDKYTAGKSMTDEQRKAVVVDMLLLVNDGELDTRATSAPYRKAIKACLSAAFPGGYSKPIHVMQGGQPVPVRFVQKPN